MAGETILVLNGPNLNLLGIREPEIYGNETLAEIEETCLERCAELELKLDFRQTNHEGELVTWIQDARGNAAGIVINAAALSHTSISVLDALKFAELPVIEVHLSNIFKREPFRHTSYVSMAADGVICGLGGQGYLLALDALWRLLHGDDEET
ncbi:MAG TPA: type II 3-dehydroquinate dehydratase [Stellaceae bacterium]|jgi:3-dehydroquinate dehydratase-2|nr:type II 3-dehydroquinate dehydratase [Stellaceae bacterium]